jgi:hypothetical protein
MSDDNPSSDKLEQALRSLAARLGSPDAQDSLAARLFEPVRRHHYNFVHQYLARRLMWEADDSLVELLCGEFATERLRELWTSVGADVLGGEDGLIPADTLECSPFHVDADHCGAMIRFPEPERTCEAYLAAVVFHADPKVRELIGYYRYFILELGRELDGSKRTVLCERNDGKHLVYSESCAPEVDEFAALVRHKFFGTGSEP